jgi:hypothetical protein
MAKSFAKSFFLACSLGRLAGAHTRRSNETCAVAGLAVASVASLAMIHRNPEAKIRRFALRPYDAAGFVHYLLQEDAGTAIFLFKALH